MALSSLKKSIHNRSRKFPLRTVLVVPFVLQIVAAVGLTGYLSFRNGEKAVNKLATQLSREVSDRIEQHAQTYLNTPHLFLQVNAAAIRSGEVDVTDFASLERYFWSQTKLSPSVDYLYFGSETGNFMGVERYDDGTTIAKVKTERTGEVREFYSLDRNGDRIAFVRKSSEYDPRVRPWYEEAVELEKPTWSPIYLSASKSILIITPVAPIYDLAGDLQGVLGIDLSLSQIGTFLRKLEISKSGQAFIIERSGEMVASSDTELPFIETEEKQKRLPATESKNPLIQGTAKHLLERFGTLDNIDKTQQFSFDLNGRRQLVEVAPMTDGRGLNWLTVVAIPEADFMAQIHENTRTTILLCVAALIVAILAGLLASRWVIKPILQLDRAADRLSQGEWDRRLEVDREDELGNLGRAFNRMAEQLQASFATLKAKNAELERLDELKDEFLANTSHELRTPLNGIIGIAESLIEGVAGPVSDRQRHNLTAIVSSGQRLATLVNDILDFAKLKHQDIQLQLRPVGLRAIAEVVLTLSQPLVGTKNLQLLNTIPEDLPLAQADENRLQQIFYNLIGNAIKFTEAGTIEVSAALSDLEREGRQGDKGTRGQGEELTSLPNTRHPTPDTLIEITVRDTGIGIPEEKRDRIFESFEQADGSTAREYGGTGLGLAVTKKLVELHGGRIAVESTPGESSIFTFTLPISPQQQAAAPASPIALSKLRGEVTEEQVQPQPQSLKNSDPSSFTILIVDDEPINRQVFCNYLSLANYTIAEASSGPKALEMLDDGFKPDLILLDVMMPRGTGYEVTKTIRETWNASELPIILLTAKNQVSDLVVGLEVGANDYLTKPIAKDELLARIKTHLNLQQLKAENLRLATELEITRKLQQMLLPPTTELEAIAGVDVAGFMEPAEEVGGDYYDVLQAGDRVKISIGDVTGHGLESGVLAIMVQTAVRTLQESEQTDSKKFLDILNRTIYNNVQRMNSDKNLSLSVLDYHQGKLRLSGQHEEAIVVRASGEVERIDTIDLGFPIGLDAEIADFVGEASIKLNSGDVVILYTDGITEAEDPNGVQYGLDRLCEVVRRDRHKTSAEIQTLVLEDVRQHISTQTVYDDITLLVLKQK